MWWAWENVSLSFYNKYKDEIGGDAWTVRALIVRQADETAKSIFTWKSGQFYLTINWEEKWKLKKYEL